MARPDNLFQFECPVFKLNVQARICFKVHETFMKGQPHPKRPGCNACLSANKCPIHYMIKEAIRTQKEAYFSTTPTVGSLSQEIISDVMPVMVLERDLKRFGCSANEIAAIEAATMPRSELAKIETGKRRKRAAAVSRGSATHKASATTDATVEAATRGDMTAAINEATKDAA
jgi:hypothetical protein